MDGCWFVTLVRTTNTFTQPVIYSYSCAATHDVPGLSPKNLPAIATVYLADRSIDCTMEGAQQRLKDFYDFKSRGNVFMIQSKLESLFNNIAVKLAYSNRPPYSPPQDLVLSGLEMKLKNLQEQYQDKRV